VNSRFLDFEKVENILEQCYKPVKNRSLWLCLSVTTDAIWFTCRYITSLNKSGVVRALRRNGKRKRLSRSTASDCNDLIQLDSRQLAPSMEEFVTRQEHCQTLYVILATLLPLHYRNVYSILICSLIDTCMYRVAQKSKPQLIYIVAKY